MTNEILFILFLFGGLGIALGASYLGKAYVYAMIIAIALYMNITEANVIEVFGFPTTLGTALYGVVFFATDMLTERYGKKAGFTAVKYAVFASVLFQLFLQGTLLTTTIGDMAWFADGMDIVFTTSLRIVVAGLFVYAISQTLDIWLFHKIYEKTGESMLWLRNNGSTIISQAVDTYLFTFLAFYGVFDDWFMMATVGYCFKLVVAFFDTGFIYASKTFLPLDLRETEE